MEFDTWKLKNLYRAGSQLSLSKEQAKSKIYWGAGGQMGR
jgi:hypothetical protein